MIAVDIWCFSIQDNIELWGPKSSRDIEWVLKVKLYDHLTLCEDHTLPSELELVYQCGINDSQVDVSRSADLFVLVVCLVGNRIATNLIWVANGSI